MTKEQIALARRLADDLDMEPSHAGANQAGEIMGRLLDEREALLEALDWIANVSEGDGQELRDAARAATAKAEAE